MALTPGGGGNPASSFLDQAKAAAMAGLGGIAAQTVDPNAPSPEAAKWDHFFDRWATGSTYQNRRATPYLKGTPPPSSISKPVTGNKGTRSFNRAKDADRQRLMEAVANILGETPSPEDLNEAWLWAVGQVDIAAKMGLEPHDPWYWLQQRATSASETRGPKTTTSTSRSVNLTDPESAKALIRSAISDALGMAATDDQVSQFTATLTAAEQANPSVTTTTTTTDEDGNSTSSSETTGGTVSAAGMAENYLDEELNAEQDVYRAATQYFDVAQALAGGIL